MNLTVRSGPDAGASITVDRRLTVGREGDFRLTDPTVSRMHAAVTPTSDGGALLEDLGSTGGTVVNGTRLFGPVTLRGGEQVLVGGSILELVVEAPAPAPEATPVVPPATAPGPPLPPPVVPPPPTPSPVLPPPAPAGGGKDRKKLMLAIALVVAIVVAMIGFVLLNGDDDAQGGGGPGGGTGGAFGALRLHDCRGNPISETVDFELTVKRAGVPGGAWAAQASKGTLEETAESSGCVTARRTFAITATRT
jgi:hypothetical protein